MRITKLTLSKTAYCGDVDLNYATSISRTYSAGRSIPSRHGWITPRININTGSSATIKMGNHAYLGPGDMSRLQQLVSAFKYWIVDYLQLTEPGPDDWAILSQLADCLTICYSLKILSTSRQVSGETISHMRNVWQKCRAENWLVNGEKYSNEDEKNFDELVEKHFK